MLHKLRPTVPEFVFDTEFTFPPDGIGNKALKKFIAKNSARLKKTKKTYPPKTELFVQLDKRYSVGYQNNSAKRSYISKPLKKKYATLTKQAKPAILFGITVHPKIDFLSVDFTDALLFKNRVNAARRRKARQQRK